MIINAGLTHVVYAGHYPDELAMKYLKIAGVKVEHFDLGERTPAPPPSVATTSRKREESPRHKVKPRDDAAQAKK
jgi:deoxycytidylate deaminase